MNDSNEGDWLINEAYSFLLIHLLHIHLLLYPSYCLWLNIVLVFGSIKRLGGSKVAVSYVWLGLLSWCYLRMSGVSQKYQHRVKTGHTPLPLIRFTPFYLSPFTSIWVTIIYLINIHVNAPKIKFFLFASVDLIQFHWPDFKITLTPIGLRLAVAWVDEIESKWTLQVI